MSLKHLVFLEKEVFTHTHTHTHHNDKRISNGHRSQLKEPQWPKLKQFDHKISKVALDYNPKYKINNHEFILI